MVPDSLLRVFIWPLRHESRWRVKSFQSALATELWVKLMYAVGRWEPRAEKKLIELDTLVLSNTADNHSARWRSLRDSPQTPLERLVYSAATFPPKHCLSLLPPLIQTLTPSSLGFFLQSENILLHLFEICVYISMNEMISSLIRQCTMLIEQMCCLGIEYLLRYPFWLQLYNQKTLHAENEWFHFTPIIVFYLEILSLVSMRTSQVGSVWFIHPLGPSIQGYITYTLTSLEEHKSQQNLERKLFV